MGCPGGGSGVSSGGSSETLDPGCEETVDGLINREGKVGV